MKRYIIPVGTLVIGLAFGFLLGKGISNKPTESPISNDSAAEEDSLVTAVTSPFEDSGDTQEPSFLSVDPLTLTEDDWIEFDLCTYLYKGDERTVQTHTFSIPRFLLVHLKGGTIPCLLNDVGGPYLPVERLLDTKQNRKYLAGEVSYIGMSETYVDDLMLRVLRGQYFMYWVDGEPYLFDGIHKQVYALPENTAFLSDFISPSRSVTRGEGMYMYVRDPETFAMRAIVNLEAGAVLRPDSTCDEARYSPFDYVVSDDEARFPYFCDDQLRVLTPEGEEEITSCPDGLACFAADIQEGALRIEAGKEDGTVFEDVFWNESVPCSSQYFAFDPEEEQFTPTGECADRYF